MKLLHWLLECIFWRKAGNVNSSPKGRSFDSCLSGDVRQAKQIPLKVVFGNTSSVVGLLLPRCPLAIFATIIAIIVFSFNGQSFGASPHVLEKFRKTISPALIHFNSPRAIEMEAIVSRIVASTLSCRPCIKFPTFSKAMLSCDLPHVLYRETSATFSVSSHQIICPSNHASAAFAQALPCCFCISSNSSPRWSAANNSQSTEGAFREIQSLCHVEVSHNIHSLSITKSTFVPP